MQKYLNKFFFITLFLCFGAVYANTKKFTVVLDAGHGGSDPGAVRAGIREADINLSIALLVGELLEKNNSDIKVAYTRKKDIKLEENERMKRANNAEGDIFVSIHVNAAYNEAKRQDITAVNGVEVYIQTVENSDRKTQTLKQKGSVIAIGDNGQEIEKKFDASIAQFNAIYEIKQAQIFNLSNNLATYIRNEMGAKDRNIRGVKQKSLYVTWQTIMPNALVEVGYITNREEREFMNSKEGQSILAMGIYNGIIEYKKDYDKSREGFVEKSNEKTDTQNIVNQTVNNNTEKQSNVQKNSPKTEQSQKDEVKNDEITFMWQIFSTSTPLKDNDERFKNLKCSYYQQNGMYKYTYGKNTYYKEVEKLREEIKKQFPDAFIIAMKNGERIDIKSIIKN